MPQTSNSSSTPYCNAFLALQFYARQIWADTLKVIPESPRPSYLAMLDPTNPAGQRLYTYLGKGAGEIESYCVIGKRYVPLDLQALTGVSQTLLQSLNAARALWCAYQFLKPGSARPQDCPGAVESAELLKALAMGERIFTFVESENAGLPSVQQASPAQLVTPNVVRKAQRLFPDTYLNRLLGGGN